MKILYSLHSLKSRFPHPILTIGVFDGIHLGHQSIIRRVHQRARERGGTAMLLTFGDHPEWTLNPGDAPPLITPPEVKREILRDLGLDLILWVPFTKDLSQKDPRAFVEEDLVGKLGVEEIWVGFDFTFGKDRRGESSLLKDLGRELGFQVEVMPPVVHQGEIVSSTLIRRKLLEGKVAEASALLGRAYRFKGRVMKGHGRGRSLGFPTANLKPTRNFLLPDGVYAGASDIGGKTYPAAIDVGSSPTFSGRERRIEAYFLNFQGNLYRRQVRIHFLERIRDERRFPSEEELIDCMREDTSQVLRIFSGWQREESNRFTSPNLYAKNAYKIRNKGEGRRTCHAPGHTEEEGTDRPISNPSAGYGFPGGADRPSQHPDQ